MRSISRSGRRYSTRYAQPGITAVELMPVQEFNDTSITRKDPHSGDSPKNYWGYDPVLFCAPKASYSSDLTEIRNWRWKLGN